MASRQHVPTKKEITANIRADGKNLPALSEADVRAFIDEQYNDLQRRFKRALANHNTHPPSITENLTKVSNSMWQLATMAWKYRWIIMKYGVYGVSTHMSGLAGPLSLLLGLVNKFTTLTIVALLAMRAKKYMRGNPRLSRREMFYVKIILTCLEWIRKLYELPITFSVAMAEAARGRYFTRTEIEELLDKKEASEISKKRLDKRGVLDKTINQNRKKNKAALQRKLFPYG